MKRLFHITTLLAALLLLNGCGRPADDLKVVSFNIRLSLRADQDGENCWNNRRDAAVRMVQQERPAAMGLQEALPVQLHYLDSCLPQYRRVGVGRDDGREQGEFMAIYYDTTRLELMDGKTLWLSETPDTPSYGWDAACRRTATLATFRDKQSGQCFCYINTHLDHVGRTARAESTKLIASLVEGQSSNMPVIVGGDMNSALDDTIFSSLYAVGLQDARTLTDSTSHAITFNNFGQGKGSVIDHFFVRDIKVLRFRTLDGNYFSEELSTVEINNNDVRNGAAFISDHYPIEILLDLGNK